MTQRTKAWSVAVAATVTLLAAAIFGISARLMVPTVLWAGFLSLSLGASWLSERYKRTRMKPVQILSIGSILLAGGATFLITSSVRWLDASVGEVFGGILAGTAWAVAALIACRSFIKGPDAPPPLRWRDLTAPRPQQ
jgi:O-antigen/teichoic acid export membrane protein